MSLVGRAARNHRQMAVDHGADDRGTPPATAPLLVAPQQGTLL